MQIRFRTYDEENYKYNLIGIVNIEDYDKAFKMFDYMKTNKCTYCIEKNTEDVSETVGEMYEVEEVLFVFSENLNEEEAICPHIAVTLSEAF